MRAREHLGARADARRAHDLRLADGAVLSVVLLLCGHALAPGGCVRAVLQQLGPHRVGPAEAHDPYAVARLVGVGVRFRARVRVRVGVRVRVRVRVGLGLEGLGWG